MVIETIYGNGQPSAAVTNGILAAIALSPNCVAVANLDTALAASDLMADGIHVTSAAVPKVADIVAAALAPHLL